MNVTFTTGDEALTSNLSTARKGRPDNAWSHRAVGGMRASIYNAMPIEGVKKLAAYMENSKLKGSEQIVPHTDFEQDIACCPGDPPQERALRDLDNFDSPEAILVRSADLHSREFDDNLCCIVRAGAGTNNIPIKDCSEGYGGFQHARGKRKRRQGAGHMRAAAQFEGHRRRHRMGKNPQDKGGEVNALVEKGKSRFTGPEILGKTLGIIGLGAIGGLVANAAVSLGMNALGCDPYLSVKSAWGLSRSVTYAPDYRTVYEQSDYITLHAPATAETKGMINKSAFACMKRGVRIINLRAVSS